MPVLSKIIEKELMTKIIHEFKRIGDKCYLDNAGAALYPESLLKHINEDLLTNLYMNPHTDKYTNDCIDQVRVSILKHFNTDLSNYSVIFTSGTTQSLKLVVESFQFASKENEVLNCGSLVYLQDNHTSVLGLREIAQEKNADVIHISHEEFLKALKTTQVTSWIEKYKNEGNTLLVYPAQSNFNGCKYPINCLEHIKSGCLNSYIRRHFGKINCNWYILLDAASFVSTNKLDLTQTQPDFVCMSFYKIFGFPTGLGALLIKKNSTEVLCNKKYFGGGTVDIVLSNEYFHVKKENLSERFEDGTVPFLSILSLKHCLDLMYKLIPKVINNNIMETISAHTFYLAKDLYKQLKNLCHPNGKRAVVLYMDSEVDDINTQGGVIAFNLLRADNSYIGYAEFQHMADLFNINVRTGCFCNSGSCQRHLKLTNNEIKEMYKAGHKCGDEVDLVFGKPTGCIRVSFGYYSTYRDVDKLISMICKCFVNTKINLPKRSTIVFNNKAQKEETEITVVDGLKDDEIIAVAKTEVSSTTKLNPTKIVLTEIAIYPIKSCGPFKLHSSWKIGRKGLDYDREWMIVKDSGVCLTQKSNTRMCMIRPIIDFKNKLLTLYFKGRDPISISLQPKQNIIKDSTYCQSKVCTDTIQGVDCGDDVANWISEALECSFLRLVRQSKDDLRSLKSKKKEDDLKLLSLSNQAQYLLINKATVRWLRDKIRDDTFTYSLDNLTDRFRGNLVIDTEKELIEREWQRIIIGKHEFKVEGMCSRCQMVCIDQDNGIKTVEPLRTISEQFNGKMRFGIYLSYIGAVDGSRDVMLKNHSTIQPINGDDDISRFMEWFFTYFITNCSFPCGIKSDTD